MDGTRKTHRPRSTQPAQEHRRVSFLWAGATRGARLVVWTLALGSLFGDAAVQGQTCTPYLLSLPKEQALYLLLPTSDTTVTVGGTTYSVGEFDAADLDTTIGTTALRDRILQIARDSYCELSVDVKSVTSTPTPAEARWQIVGIGTDTDASGAFGLSYGVDTNDSQGQDFARVWSDQFDVTYGGTGGALDGTGSTLERWATIIGGTAVHEGGHNYGLNHTDAAPRTGTTEDATLNHVMATGNDFGATVFERGDNRAKRIRHFSDTSFEILGHNIGLNAKTLSNWDFVNPNDVNATELRITVLSTASSLSFTSVYGGNLSPWSSPTITQRSGTQAFHGTTYNIFDIDFSTARAWANGPDGTVPPGIGFHVGAGLSATFLVWEVALSDSSGELDLQPRMAGYDAGSLDSDGDFDVGFVNTDADRGALILRDVEILFLPRPVAIDNMVVGGELVTREGLQVQPFPRRPRPRGEYEDRYSKGQEYPPITGKVPELRLRDEVPVPVARLTDRRHVDIEYDPTGCTPGIRTPGGFVPFEADVDEGEVIYCPDGPALSLFPASFTYVRATVVDPSARFWDPDQGRFVNGPLESRLFYQFAGIVPDLNENGRDDLLDIREGTSRDDNGNGIPDEADAGGGRFAVSARFGSTVPHTTGLDPGVSFNLGFEGYLSPQLTLEGIVGYHDFDGATGGSLEAIQLSVNLRLFVAGAGPWRFFVNGGAGAYLLDPGSTEAGVNAGFGADWALSSGLALEAAVNYHDVEPGSNGFEFSTAQIGLRWEL